jgi:hypothetical protein
MEARLNIFQTPALDEDQYQSSGILTPGKRAKSYYYGLIVDLPHSHYTIS